ncbi:PREDICTED: putative defensin-like protein 119 [Camelina sativa]|uniref:Defensin-like protein 119 n=1 Tax=Camelina sativa TaxID=90675 RepID=A0ABM1RQ15_CAMSA|nr:PREDICTED: putative defensin-like protein 119 [Camelina sativa]
MTKATIHLAIFMMVLVFGMATAESTQGQEICHDIVMKGQTCVPSTCATICKQKWKGSGKCFPNGFTQSCLCTFPCNS